MRVSGEYYIYYPTANKLKAATMKIADAFPGRVVELNWKDGSPYWLLPEYALAVDPFGNGYSVHILSGDNWVLGDIGDYDIMLGEDLTVADIVALVEMLDADVAHAKQWIVSDAENGLLGDEPHRLNNFESLWSTKAHPNFYLLGCGDLTKDHDDWIGVTPAEEGRMKAHIKARDPKGLIGRGLPSAGDGPNKLALEGYLFTLTNAVNTWIVKGALREIEVRNKGPKI